MVFWILLAFLVAYSVRRIFFGYPRPRRSYGILAPREVAFLEAAAEATFPAGGAIPLSGQDADLSGYADDFLAVLPGHLRLQVRAMLMLFEQATLFFPAPGPGGRRRFSSLAPSQRVAVLEGWARSRFFLRRLAFTALRAVLTMGYLGHPVAMRYLRLAPLDFPSPVCEADLLYPAIGARPESIRYREADLWQSDGSALDPNGPIHPDFLGETRQQLGETRQLGRLGETRR